MADDMPGFRVHLPPELSARLRAWARQMTEAGRKADFVAAVKALNNRLKHAPEFWGDPLADYKYILAHEVRGMIPGWFIVWYGIAIDARYVRVRDIRPAPGSPLAPLA